MTVFWHRTNRRNVEEILKDGFRDSSGSYLTTNTYTGVWLSNRPLTGADCISVTDDDVLLRITLPLTLDEMAEYEWVYEMVPDPDTGELCNPSNYREWLVPAKVLNGAADFALVEEDDLE
jgi:hypothetical protein